MSDLSSAASSSVNSVSGAMDLVVSAARSGAADAREAAARAVSSSGLFLSRAVYQLTYTVSYGMVFPVAFVAAAVPRNNAAVRGIVEGAQAASRRVDSVLGRTI
jgi:hypothetical protein